MSPEKGFELEADATARGDANPSACRLHPVDVTAVSPEAEAETEAETQEYYSHLRQRAAEKPLLGSVLLRVGEEISADEKERWLAFGAQRRDQLVSTIEVLISELEGEPPINVLKKLSIAEAIWCLMQSMLEDASNALALERSASKHEYKAKATQPARHESARISRIRMDTAKELVEEYISRNPEASQTKIAQDILPALNSALAKSDVPIMSKGRTLGGLVGGLLKNAKPDARRKFQKRLPESPRREK
jgi:hypothetical protein